MLRVDRASGRDGDLLPGDASLEQVLANSLGQGVHVRALQKCEPVERQRPGDPDQFGQAPIRHGDDDAMVRAQQQQRQRDVGATQDHVEETPRGHSVAHQEHQAEEDVVQFAQSEREHALPQPQPVRQPPPRFRQPPHSSLPVRHDAGRHQLLPEPGIDDQHGLRIGAHYEGEEPAQPPLRAADTCVVDQDENAAHEGWSTKVRHQSSRLSHRQMVKLMFFRPASWASNSFSAASTLR